MSMQGTRWGGRVDDVYERLIYTNIYATCATSHAKCG